MGWFSEWWSGLSLVGQIMACAAIPMTVVMFLQLILMIIGVGFGGEADGGVDDGGIDTTAETTPPDSKGYGTPSTFKLFTIRGIVAFFALGGWAGLAALAAGLHPFWAIQISLFTGVCALMLAAIVIRLALRMQTSGNLNINNAVAKTGDVYIRVPAGRSEKGKVTLLLQERFVELDAVTDSDTDILPETKVEVLSIADGDTLVVRSVDLSS
jgi:hypothetical protein